MMLAFCNADAVRGITLACVRAMSVPETEKLQIARRGLADGHHPSESTASTVVILTGDQRNREGWRAARYGSSAAALGNAGSGYGTSVMVIATACSRTCS